MQRLANCVAVIPCLNEGATLFPLVEAVLQHVSHVIVVDDGSTDQTAAIAGEAGAEVLRHEKTRGKGAALNTGWRRAADQGFDWALTMDGDGQHAPDDIPALLSCAMRGEVDLVAGNRMANAGQMPWVRRQVNQWMSRRLSHAAGLWLPDSQCGFRLMKLSAWSTVSIQTSHFEIESEVLLAFIEKGYAIEFVPVQCIYKSERSKIHPVRDTWRWFRWWRRAGRRFSGARSSYSART